MTNALFISRAYRHIMKEDIAIVWSKFVIRGSKIMSEVRKSPLQSGLNELEKVFQEYKNKLEHAEQEANEIIDVAWQKAETITFVCADCGLPSDAPRRFLLPWPMSLPI